ncbi:MAG: recombinase family protein [Actinobacteria bacterium]|nr:recombinase family protein [Actinomycetota bacterium]
MSEHQKITDQHRRRRAVVYVRQSTLTQVERNTESLARQYALRERAVELGWPEASVVVVDGDLGRSGASTEGRMGFKELVAEVGLGQVGLVLALEVSRLARCSADWHQLLDLCALTTTLIADADGIYSPADFNDRLLLGLKGTMSEAELHLIRARLDGGLRNKAQRGELRQSLPVGLDRDDEQRIVLCPDEQVRQAIERVFSLWRRVGSARQVVAELVAEGQRLPRRTVGQRRIRWARANYAAVHDFLTNPAYAGAFVFGRTRQHKQLDGEGKLRTRTVELALEEWSVCLPEHHPGYVCWDEYLATRKRLRQNVRARGEGGGAAREGTALLQGLARCGRCGRRMQVAYSGRDGRVPRYACVRGHQLHATERACQSLGGLRLDKAVAEAFLDAVTPADVRASTGAIEELEREHEERLRGQLLALERAEFEAGRAQRQFDACEPEHRLVARTLERQLEAALAQVERERRELAALEQGQATVAILWEGGARSELGVRLNRRGPEGRRTEEDTVELVRRLAAHHPDRQIAAILSKQGRRTATGLPFTEPRVRHVRHAAGIAPAPPPDSRSEVVTIAEAAAQLEVSTATVRRWLREGLLPGEQTTPHAPWRIRLTDEVRRRFVPEVPDGFLALDEAAKRLGVARQTVLHKVQRGELEAIHVTAGRRKGLRIQVSGDEAGLFAQ